MLNLCRHLASPWHAAVVDLSCLPLVPVQINHRNGGLNLLRQILQWICFGLSAVLIRTVELMIHLIIKVVARAFILNIIVLIHIVGGLVGVKKRVLQR